MLWPYLDIGHVTASASATVGALCALTAAFTNAGSVIQTRRLTASETTSSFFFYFSLICMLFGAVTLPFAWATPSPGELAALVAVGIIGGLSHIFLTESYRYASASTVAPFDYVAMLWAFLFGYAFFGEIPTVYVFVGSAIVAASGLFVIWRERQRGIERARAGVLAGQPGGRGGASDDVRGLLLVVHVGISAALHCVRTPVRPAGTCGCRIPPYLTILKGRDRRKRPSPVDFSRLKARDSTGHDHECCAAATVGRKSHLLLGGKAQIGCFVGVHALPCRTTNFRMGRGR